MRIDKGVLYWFLPVCGGMKLDSDRVVVITPHSPLGEMLDGAEQDETLENGCTVLEIR